MPVSSSANFQHLGQPVQKLLLDLEGKGGTIDEETMELFTHITVRQLAKIYEMMGEEQDPEAMISWLRQRAKKSKEDKEKKKREEEERERKRKEEEERAAREAEEAEKKRKEELQKKREEARKKKEEEEAKKAEEAKKGAEAPKEAPKETPKEEPAKEPEPEKPAEAPPAPEPAAEEPAEQAAPARDGWDRKAEERKAEERKAEERRADPQADLTPAEEDERAPEDEDEDAAWQAGLSGDEDEDGKDGDADSVPDDSRAADSLEGLGATEEAAAAAEEEDTAAPEEKAAQPEAPAAPKRKPPAREMPITDVPSPEYLKMSFPVLKWNPGGKRHKAPRVWQIDLLAATIGLHNGNDGKLKQEYKATQLLQVEKSIADTRRLRLAFAGGETHQMLFPSAEDRERFYECASAIRPAIRLYAPALAADAPDGGSTKIGGSAPISVKQRSPLRHGQEVTVELAGSCEVRASPETDDKVPIWCGTFNLGGADPPDLTPWMPRGTHAIYVVCAQDCGEQRHPGRWLKHVAAHLGKEYAPLAHLEQWDMAIAVMVRRRHLLKITNCEGSRVPTTHAACGNRGGVAVSFLYQNTSMCFISAHLASAPEANELRKTNLSEICSRTMLGSQELDVLTQFHHVFLIGDLGYRIELAPDEIYQLAEAAKYRDLLMSDGLVLQQIDEGVLHGFGEAPVKFPPTYPIMPGSGVYDTQQEAPSYRDRILIKSARNAPIECKSYERCEAPALAVGGHLPVSASFEVSCLRPSTACFAPPGPRPMFSFKVVRIEEWHGEPIELPELVVRGHFVDGQHRGTAPRPPAGALPSFVESQLPQGICSATHVLEFVERQSLFLVFRDRAHGKKGKVYTETKVHRKVDKGLRGAASLDLDDGVTPFGKVKQRELEVFYHGQMVGIAHVEYVVSDAGPAPLPGLPEPKPVAPPPDLAPVRVKVYRARGLCAKMCHQPFCEVKLRAVVDGKVTPDHKHPQKHTTKVIKGTTDPVFDESFIMRVCEQDALRISLFSKATMGKDYLGKVDVMMGEVLPGLEEGRPANLTCPVAASEEKDKKSKLPELGGELDLVLELLRRDAPEVSASAAAASSAAAPPRSAAGETHTVTVIVANASGLAEKKNPFCEIKLRAVGPDGKVQADHKNPQKKSTKTVRGTAEPVWDEAFPFRVTADDAIRVSIFSAGVVGKDNLGRVDLLMGELLPQLRPGAGPTVKKYPINTSECKKAGGGEMEIGVALSDDPEQ